MPEEANWKSWARRALGLGLLHAEPVLNGGISKASEHPTAERREDARRGNLPATPPPAQIGSYRILRVLGEGGMGTVYEAEQDKPRRIVALKVIRPGFATPEMLRRFEQESQVLGRLQHPGIAQIHEAGMANAGYGPQPYFAMEFVRGSTLDEHAEAERLSTEERLELLARIADAVQHAHEKGIVHRDLKPGNILVDVSGQPKILDFGVARVTAQDLQATMQTRTGTFVGTLPYMSPEQVSADSSQLDARSDVYTLGVILYQLLAGHLPHDLEQKTLPEAARIIREDDPSRLSLVSRTLRGDVETIAAKALEKEKERRYQSAADLAADIRRYLKDEPITARPTSTAYQLRKFAGRNKALVVGLAAVFVVLVVGVVVSSWQAVRATRAEGLATSRLAETQQARALAESRQQESEQARRLAEERRTEAENQKVEAERARGAEAEQRLVAEASALRAKQEAAKAEAVNTFLQDMLSSVDPSQMKGREVTVRQVLDEAAKKVGDGSLQNQPEIDAAVRTTLGNTYRGLGLYPEAETHLRTALEIRKRSAGEDQLDVANSLDELAVLMHARGELAEAEPLYREALRIRRRVLGGEHRDVALSLSNLAVLLYDRGDLAGAEPLYREALRIRRKVLGDEHPDVARILSSLAVLLQARGDLVGAEPLYRESLAIRRKALGEEHPEVALTLSNLAELLRVRGDLAGAEPLCREALAIRRKTLGDEHPEVAMSLNNLAALLDDKGDFEGAQPLYRESLAIRRKALGEEHPEVAQSLNNLAELFRVRGDLAAAEPLYREALAIWRKALGEEHPDVALVLNNLGFLLKSRGDLAGAEPLYREALAIRRKALGEEHPDVAASLNNLAALLQARDDLVGAEPLYHESLAIRRKVLGDDHPTVAAVLANMGALSLDESDPVSAEPLLRESLAIRTKKLPARHPDVAASQAILGLCLIRQGRHVEAEPLLREALSIREEKLPQDHWSRPNTRSLLGEALAGQKKFEEAEPLLVQAYEDIKNSAAAPAARKREARERIERLYESWGKPDKAAAWRVSLGEGSANATDTPRP